MKVGEKLQEYYDSVVAAGAVLTDAEGKPSLCGPAKKAMGIMHEMLANGDAEKVQELDAKFAAAEQEFIESAGGEEQLYAP